MSNGTLGRFAVEPLTISIASHSLLRILLISPVRIIWLAADICGRRRRANIMNAFMGRLGVPSVFRVCEVSARCGSSGHERRQRRATGRAREGRLACVLEVVAAGCHGVRMSERARA